ncbi:MAG: hypothetical protein ACRDD8_06155 [Bacteroidales bacterium]
MHISRIDRQIELTKKRITQAQRNRDFARVVKLMNELKALENIKTPTTAKDVFAEMPNEDIVEAHKLMRKIPVFADLLESTSLDLVSVFQRTDPSIELVMLKYIQNIAKNAKELVKMVDAVNNYQMSENFGDMCDRIGFIVDNAFNAEDFKLSKKTA